MLTFDLKRGVDYRKVFPKLFQTPPFEKGLWLKKSFFLGRILFGKKSSVINYCLIKSHIWPLALAASIAHLLNWELAEMDGPFIKIHIKNWAFPIFQRGSPGGAKLLNNRFCKRVLINAKKNLGSSGLGCFYLFKLLSIAHLLNWELAEMDGPFIKIHIKNWAFPIFQRGSPGGAKLLNNRFCKRVLINAIFLVVVALATQAKWIELRSAEE